jgi:dTDP-4-amino-4,6-dideoxygalactose transaminase
MVPFLELRRQCKALRRELDPAIAAVVEKGRFVLGENVSRFEAEWASYCGARHCVGVGSGLDALVLSLKASGVGPGDDVLTPANVIFGAIAARLCGARPALVDVQPDTGLIDVRGLEAALTPAARAVIPVHLYGQMADMEAIVRFARSHGLKVLEDASHAHGASFRGRRAGAWSDLGCFSFYPTKNLGASGEAGAVVTDSAELAETVRSLRDYGRSGRDRFERIGTNSRLDELQAAVLRVKLTHLDRWNAARREIAARYRSAFTPSSRVRPIECLDEREHVCHLFVLRCARRDDLAAFLAGRGVETQIHYATPVHRQPAFADLGMTGESFPAAERFCSEVLSLPCFPELTTEEIGETIRAVQSFEKEG